MNCAACMDRTRIKFESIPIPIEYLTCDKFKDYQMSEKSLKSIESGNYQPAFFESMKDKELRHEQHKICVANANDAREFQSR